jgi:hypothetical protein
MPEKGAGAKTAARPAGKPPAVAKAQPAGDAGASRPHGAKRGRPDGGAGLAAHKQRAASTLFEAHVVLRLYVPVDDLRAAPRVKSLVQSARRAWSRSVLRLAQLTRTRPSPLQPRETTAEGAPSLWAGLELRGEAHDVHDAAARIGVVVEEMDDAVLSVPVAAERLRLLTSGPRASGSGSGGGGPLAALQRISVASGARVHVPTPAPTATTPDSARAGSAAAPPQQQQRKRKGGAGAAESDAAPAPAAAAALEPTAVSMVSFEGSLSEVFAGLAHALAALLAAAGAYSTVEFEIPGASAPCAVCGAR